MSKIEAKKIVIKYAQALKNAGFILSAIYLFGSYVKGKPNEWSDIDVAIVTDKLKRNVNKNRLLLWKLRRLIDNRIEPHGFTIEDFKNDLNPMVYEIKKNGIKII